MTSTNSSITCRAPGDGHHGDDLHSGSSMVIAFQLRLAFSAWIEWEEGWVETDISFIPSDG